MLTKIFRLGIFLALAVLISLGTASAQKKVTVHGEVVEVTSFIKEGLKPTSPSKKEVILENLKKGGMFGIVNKANVLYLIVPSANDTAFVKNVSPYLGVKSFIKGTTYMRAGVRILMLEDIGKSLK
ncbi:MAG: hypothetical protein HZB59_02715 [Ignavibacteriales bacterium]|nr:hypothetical protein [Ignavibacteriales bacterium]